MDFEVAPFLLALCLSALLFFKSFYQSTSQYLISSFLSGAAGDEKYEGSPSAPVDSLCGETFPTFCEPEFAIILLGGSTLRRLL